MKTLRSHLSNSNRTGDGFRKVAGSQLVQTSRIGKGLSGSSGLNRLMRNMDAKLDRAEKQIDAVLERQASRKP